MSYISEFEEKQPRIILTDRTYNSVTVSFDHFAPDDYDRGYIAMVSALTLFQYSLHEFNFQYKSFSDNRWKSHEDKRGEEGHHEASGVDLPSITITDLKPKTKYMVRVAIYEDYQTRTLGRSTAVIEVETNVGCVTDDNSTHAVGSFSIGCDKKCECLSSGKVKCGPRCEAPFHRSGTSADDPLCVEQFVDGEECCVIITCAGNAEEPESPCTDIEVRTRGA